MVGGGLPIAEQMKVATRPVMTYWSCGGVIIRGGCPVVKGEAKLVKIEEG